MSFDPTAPIPVEPPAPIESRHNSDGLHLAPNPPIAPPASPETPIVESVLRALEIKHQRCLYHVRRLIALEGGVARDSDLLEEAEGEDLEIAALHKLEQPKPAVSGPSGPAPEPRHEKISRIKVLLIGTLPRQTGVLSAWDNRVSVIPWNPHTGTLPAFDYAIANVKFMGHPTYHKIKKVAGNRLFCVSGGSGQIKDAMKRIVAMAAANGKDY